MTELPSAVPALVADASGDQTRLELRELSFAELGTDEVVVAVDWSGVNYKDGLASRKDGKVARIDPLVPGIDLAGTVVDPGGAPLVRGQAVLVHGYDLGVAHHGGYARYSRVPAEWVVPLPDGLTGRQAMVLGTAGFTAALSVIALEEHGLVPGAGPVLVTGASGGVGSVAVSILAARGHEVTAVTGKREAADWLRSLGAADVVDRSVLDPERPLQKERWAGAVDCVGGATLAAVLASLRYGAAVAASGNTGGMALPTTVLPFILRGVALLGIDSVQCPIDLRRAVWQRLATDLRPAALDDLATEEVPLDGVPAALERILAGGARGRTLVRIG
ncbi:acryloyl-CoA reductase [Blastococcus sp. BMG 814]|uniref:Acryloyl-CoA reductase n=1 Tax=Blastococcus carthaginiensis TaxID=3050034 RepID=A0ABT9IDF1_9ACTN|nr:acryloyl-CoA reductase [Blastococcus carthaginiensis]MDP5183615.1 acryloyl-CoA reductase [Blastococcus carthaginiensis]